MTYGANGLDIKDLALRVGAGRLSLSGHSGSTLALKANAAGLPLAAADLFSPGLGLSGVADGEATIGGTPSNPTGEWHVRLQRVVAPQMRNAGLPALDVAGSGRLAGGRTSLDATINAGTGNAVRVTGSAPLAPDGALDVKVDGALDARLANSMLSVSGRHAAGSLGGRASGARDDCEAAGARNGSLERRRTPRRSDGIQAFRRDGDIRRERKHDPDRSSSQGRRRTPVRSAPPAKCGSTRPPAFPAPFA